MDHLLNKIHLADCMDLMAQLPDKCIDLAIVDPPYGIKADRMFKETNIRKDPRNGRDIITTPRRIGNWDNKRPDKKYFQELERITKNRIIFGGNYFADLLPPKSCWVVWDKVNGKCDQADCELIWTSFNTAVRQIRFMWTGLLQGKSITEGHINQGNKKLCEKRYHPTQKPIALYRWLLQKYAKEGDIILDTHCGSGSSVIACIEEGFQYIACELDPDYYKDSLKRVNKKYKELETGLGLVNHTKRSLREQNKMKELFEE